MGKLKTKINKAVPDNNPNLNSLHNLLFNTVAREMLYLHDGPEQQLAFMRETRRKDPSRLFVLSWEGWENDPREVHEIPEIRAFCFRMLRLDQSRNELPGLLAQEAEYPLIQMWGMGFGAMSFLATALSDASVVSRPSWAPSWERCAGGWRLAPGRPS